MHFEKPLVKGKLIRRYKRFLADVELENGEIIVAHCTNTGSMKSCIEEGAPVMLSTHSDPKRKTKFTWEMIFMNGGWIGINTMVPNKLIFQALVEGSIEKLGGYPLVKKEVQYGDSRIDLMAENDNEKCFIEVKNVSMKEGRTALFPDAVTTRGLKHLNTLMQIKTDGHRAIILFAIQRTDVDLFMAADKIDPKYAFALKQAYESGVEIIPLQIQVTPEHIMIIRELPFQL